MPYSGTTSRGITWHMRPSPSDEGYIIYDNDVESKQVYATDQIEALTDLKEQIKVKHAEDVANMESIIDTAILHFFNRLHLENGEFFDRTKYTDKNYIAAVLEGKFDEWESIERKTLTFDQPSIGRLCLFDLCYRMRDLTARILLEDYIPLIYQKAEKYLHTWLGEKDGGQNAS